jgi:hypothetical protein
MAILLKFSPIETDLRLAIELQEFFYNINLLSLYVAASWQALKL